MTGDSDSPPPIRRGRSLRLSTEEVPSEEPPTEASGELPVRGRGLHLSVATDATLSVASPVSEALPSVEPAPVSEALPGAELIPLHRRYRRTNRGWLSYLDGGRGRPLLLLHGWGASARIWVGVGSVLVDFRTIYALDLPGAGGVAPRSGALPSTHSLRRRCMRLMP